MRYRDAKKQIGGLRWFIPSDPRRVRGGRVELTDVIDHHGPSALFQAVYTDTREPVGVYEDELTL